jgi:hypothetical protein
MILMQNFSAFLNEFVKLDSNNEMGIWVFDIVSAMEALVGLHLELGQVSVYKHLFQCFICLFLNFEIYDLYGGGSSYIG